MHRQGAVAARDHVKKRDPLPTRRLNGPGIDVREIKMNYRGGGVGIIGVIVIVVVILFLVGVIKL